MIRKSVIAILGASLMLAACQTDNWGGGESFGTLGGAAAGGLIGSQIGRGSGNAAANLTEASLAIGQAQWLTKEISQPQRMPNSVPIQPLWDNRLHGTIQITAILEPLLQSGMATPLTGPTAENSSRPLLSVDKSSRAMARLVSSLMVHGKLFSNNDKRLYGDWVKPCYIDHSIPVVFVNYHARPLSNSWC